MNVVRERQCVCECVNFLWVETIGSVYVLWNFNSLTSGGTKTAFFIRCIGLPTEVDFINFEFDDFTLT